MMATKDDWMMKAAEEIASDPNCCGPEEAFPVEMAKIIEKWCPLDAGVAYMPVPRCDQCRWWIPYDEYRGVCEADPDLVSPERDPQGLLDTAATFACVRWEAK